MTDQPPIATPDNVGCICAKEGKANTFCNWRPACEARGIAPGQPSQPDNAVDDLRDECRVLRVRLSEAGSRIIELERHADAMARSIEGAFSSAASGPDGGDIMEAMADALADYRGESL